MKKRFTEQQIIGFLRSGARGGGERSMPTARVLGSQLLPAAQQAEMDVSGAKPLKALESENARLKNLLAESTLERVDP